MNATRNNHTVDTMARFERGLFTERECETLDPEVRVLHIESAEIGHQIQFSLQATLQSDPPEPIALDATIAANGRIRVTV